MTGCYAKGCKNASIYGVKMNFFPKDPKRRAAWINNCKKFKATMNKALNKHSALCEYHFAPEMWEKPRIDGKKKLKYSAEPTIFGDSIPQENKRLKEISVKFGKLEETTVLSDPSSKCIQILTIGSEQILSNSEMRSAKKPRYTIETIKDPLETTNERLLSAANKNASLLLNNNMISFSAIGALPTFCTKSVEANGTNTAQENDINITNESHLQSEDNSDTDSFIANNFEPVSDEESDSDDNFEPVSNELVGFHGRTNVQEDDNKVLASIAPEEKELHALQDKLASATDDTGAKCSRCEKVEKVYLKSERIRNIMKKKFKQRTRTVQATIRTLENRVKALEGSLYGLRKLLNEDQIDFLSSDLKKVSKWSESTLAKGKLYWSALGPQGYQFLLDQHWPLPAFVSIHKKAPKKKIVLADDNMDKDSI